MTEIRDIAIERLQRWWTLPILVMLFFAVGLWLFFPTQAIQQRLEQELTKQLQRPVSVGSVALQLPATLAVSSLETTATAELPLRFTDLTLKPVWHRLFSSAPAAKLTTSIFDGQLYTELDTSNYIQFSGHDFHWDAPLPQLPTLHLQATVQQLNGSAYGQPVNQLEELTLHLSKLQLSGLKQMGLAVDSLNLGTVLLKISQNKQRLSIEQLASRNGDVIINGSGKINLNRNPLHSRLDLNLTLSPSQSLDPAVSSLLPLFAKKQKDGKFAIRVNGTLAKPQLR